MNGVDLSRFEFDYDTTWTSFFTDSDLNIYSRYGGRDETASDARLNKESLLQTMREVLAAHEQRKQPGIKQIPAEPLVHPAPPPETNPEDIPLLKNNHQGCVHCHQVQEYRLLQKYHDGKFTSKDLFTFPLPEKLGIRFDLKHGHKILKVEPNSAAAKAGFQVGDVVTRVEDVPIRSEQDVRWALHRSKVEDGGVIPVVVRRSGMNAGAGKAEEGVTELKQLELRTIPHWRQSDLGWRKSLRSIPLALGFLGYDLGSEEVRKENLPKNHLAIRVVSLRGPGLAKNLGLLKGDVIVGIEETSRERTFDEFKSDLLKLYKPGDLVRLKVLREGKPLELKGQFADWFTDVFSVP